MADIPMGPYEKIDIVNKLIREIRDVKVRFPELKVQHNPDNVGSVLNAYREGDLSFEEAVATISSLGKQPPSFQTGEYVAYVTRDQFGDEPVVGKVIGIAGDRCDLEIINSGTRISPKAETLTHIKLVWRDTHEPVKKVGSVSEELKEGWYRCDAGSYGREEWLVRYLRGGESYLCDPDEFKNAGCRVSDRLRCGPVTQYQQVKPMERGEGEHRG